VRVLQLTLMLALSVPMLGAGQIPVKPQETFSARVEAGASGEVAATSLTIHVERYTTSNEQHAAMTALQTGGAAGLTAALRMMPSTGYVEVGVRRWAIRYASQEATPTGRHIVIVLDQPMCFRDGQENARRNWFDVAVIKFDVGATGTGEGTVAAAARIVAGGPAGDELTDDSDERITLVAVTKIDS